MGPFLSALLADFLAGGALAALLLHLRDADLSQERRFRTRQLERATSDVISDAKGVLLGMMENAPLGLAVLDMGGCWKLVNSEVEKILGRTSSELTSGMCWQDVTSGDTLEEDEKQVQLLVDGHISRYTYSKKYLHSDGYEVPVKLTVFLGSLATESVFVALIQDMTHELLEKARTKAFEIGATNRIEVLEKRCQELQGILSDHQDSAIGEGLSQLRDSIKNLGEN